MKGLGFQAFLPNLHILNAFLERGSYDYEIIRKEQLPGHTYPEVTRQSLKYNDEE